MAQDGSKGIHDIVSEALACGNRMRESRTFGSVGGEGGNVLAYPANTYGREQGR